MLLKQSPPDMRRVSDMFSAVSRKVAAAAGSWQASILAIAVILLWAATGPMFGFSDTWQLLCNTGTTIVTFIMVFLIQGDQNRDSRAVQAKLSEIICALEKADNRLIDLEQGTDEQIEQARQQIASHKDAP